MPLGTKTCKKPKPQRKALYIGITYASVGVSNADTMKLRGPHDDCRALQQFVKKYKYKPKDSVMLLDTKKNMENEEFAHLRPTKENIIREMENLVRGAKDGDHFLFHYSGHGHQVPVKPGDKDEEDDMDEALVPCDARDIVNDKGEKNYDPETLILDNEMYDKMASQLPSGAHLLAIYDMCHAGTALDLRNHYRGIKGLRKLTSKVMKQGTVQKRTATIIPNPTAGVAEGNGAFTSHPRADPKRRGSGDSSFRIHLTRRTTDHNFLKKTYILDTQTNESKPGKPRIGVVRSRSTSLNLDGPAGVGLVSSVITSARSSSPAQWRPPCQKCGRNVPEDRRDSIMSTERQRTFDETPVIPPRPVSPPEMSASGKSCVPCTDIRWPRPKVYNFLRRKAKSMDSSLNSGHDVNTRTPRTKAASEGSVMSDAPLLSTGPKQTMTTILENEIAESPTSTVMEHQFSPLQLAAAPLGWCECWVTKQDEGPVVISFASCSDGQTTFENPEGVSVTKALIEILKKNPHPTYNELMKEMSRWLSDQAQLLFKYYSDRKKLRERMQENPQRRRSTVMSDLGEDLVSAMMESLENPDDDAWEEHVLKNRPVQTPQLGSQKLLNLDDTFSP